MTGGQNKHACDIKKSRQLGLVAKATESNISQPVYPRLFFQCDALFAVPDNHEIGQGAAHSSLDQDMVRVQEIGAAFSPLQLRSKQNDRSLSVNIELSSQLFSLRHRVKASLLKIFVVHRVRHQKERNIVTQIMPPVFLIQRPHGQNSVHQILQQLKEQFFQEKFRATARAISHPHVTAQQHR